MGENSSGKGGSGGTGPYLILMVGILGALVALFFTVRAVSIRINEKRDAARKTELHLVATSSGAAVVEDDAQADQENGNSSSEQDKENSAVAGPGQDTVSDGSPSEDLAESAVEKQAEPVGSGEDAAEMAEVSSAEAFAESVDNKDSDIPGGPLLKNEVPAASAIAAKYFDAVTAQDEAALEEIMDVVPDQLRELVRKEHKVYSDVEVYTKEGPDDRSYIVIATYRSTTNGSSTALPNYKQWLIRQNEEGRWQIIRSEPDLVTKSWIDTVMADEEVSALIEGVKKEREEALAAEKASKAASETTATNDTGAAEGTETAAQASETGQESGDEGSNLPTGHVISNVNLRSGGGFEYEVIATLPTGAEVILLGGDAGGWYHVQYDGMEGYAGHSYIKVD